MPNSGVRIEPWAQGDLHILEKTLGDPEMTRYVGGPETAEKLAERQAMFEGLAKAGTGRMFKIVEIATGEAVGSVGYWDKTWRGDEVYEAGWFVLPGFQGRGIATEATAQAIQVARSDGTHRFLHAFPSVQNEPSNAICGKLGFTFIEESEFEFPPGNVMRCNDWRLDLTADTERTIDMATTRTAHTDWHGSLTEGSGVVHLDSSGLGSFDVTWASRAEDANGKTSPEELIAAAHASCFSMAFSARLAKAGSSDPTITTIAEVDFQPGEGITGVRLHVTGEAPGLDDETFRTLAEDAKQNCPVSQALAAVPISLSVG